MLLLQPILDLQTTYPAQTTNFDTPLHGGYRGDKPTPMIFISTASANPTKTGLCWLHTMWLFMSFSST